MSRTRFEAPAQAASGPPHKPLTSFHCTAFFAKFFSSLLKAARLHVFCFFFLFLCHRLGKPLLQVSVLVRERVLLAEAGFHDKLPLVLNGRELSPFVLDEVLFLLYL